jgi:hypothetical protein
LKEVEVLSSIINLIQFIILKLLQNNLFINIDKKNLIEKYSDVNSFFNYFLFSNNVDNNNKYNNNKTKNNNNININNDDNNFNFSIIEILNDFFEILKILNKFYVKLESKLKNEKKYTILTVNNNLLKLQLLSNNLYFLIEKLNIFCSKIIQFLI